MKKSLLIALLAIMSSCNINLPIQIYDEANSKQLNESEKKIDALNPKEKCLVSFIGVYKNDDIKLLVDGKEVFHKKLKNENLSIREFVDSYIGDKPKEQLQIFINNQSVVFKASKIDEKRYVIVDKDSFKKIFLSKSPIFKGVDDFYDNIQSINKGRRGNFKLIN